MSTNSPRWTRWPAMEQRGRTRRWRLPCGLGIWGGPGATPQTAWLATSEGFTEESRRRTESLYLGDENAPAPALVWHSDHGVYQAIGCHPKDGRLQRRVLELSISDKRPVPAALAAIALLTQLDVPVPDEPFGTPIEPVQIFIDERAAEEQVETGCRELARAFDAETLARVYARLLAGGFNLSLPHRKGSLSPIAFASLLLPLQPAMADRLSMVSWLPSTHYDPQWSPQGGDGSEVRWHIIGVDGSAPARLPRAPEPDAHSRAVAETMAQAILSGDPDRIRHERRLGLDLSTPDRARPTGSMTPTTLDIRVWGSPSSGKTVYLAYLFLKYRTSGSSGWTASLPPNADTEHYDQRLVQFVEKNLFYDPTGRGQERVTDYRLTGPNGRQMLISMDDRAGGDNLELSDRVVEALANAKGLVFLLDPNRDRGKQEMEVRRACMRISQRGNGDKHPAPLAVCVSKCDELIHSLEDYHLAHENPKEFLGDVISPGLCDAIDAHFSRYQYFALSAAGLRIVHGTIEPGVIYDENLNPRPNPLAEPINLLEPLVWLLEEIGQ